MRALADLVAPSLFSHDLLPGRVVDAEDPLKRGRVRVRVEQVYGDPETEDEVIPDNLLPWARVNCLRGGQGTGGEWTPLKDSAVLVTAWRGDWERPIVVGAWHPAEAEEGDHRIPEHVSSYDGTGPKTMVARTEGDQLIEMRWKKGEQKYQIRMASGTRILLEDATEENGVFVDIVTPKGFHFRLDEPALRATLETPGGRHVFLDDSPTKLFAEMATPTRSVRLDDKVQFAEMKTPNHHVRLDDAVQFAEMATPLRKVRLDEANHYATMETPFSHVKLDDTIPSAEMATPLRKVRLDDQAQQAEMVSPLRSLILDDAAQTATLADPANTIQMAPGVINITTPGAANVTAGGAANVTAGGAATVSAAGVATVSGTAGAAIGAPGSALTLGAGGAPSTQTSGGLMTSTFTGFALYNFLGALTYAVTGAWLVNVTGLASIASVGILSLFGSAVVLGTLAGTKRRLLNELAIIIYNSHTHVVPSPGPTVTLGPSPIMVVGVDTTTDTTAS